MIETITWVSVAERLPDADMTVLVAAPTCSEPIWLGFHDGEQWLSAESACIDVTHWADLPRGPAPAADKPIATPFEAMAPADAAAWGFT